MPIDASIPLSVQQPKMMGPQDLISLQNLQRQGDMQKLELERAQRQKQNQGQISELMKDPNNVDVSTGTLNTQGISKVSAIDPQYGFSLAQLNEQALSRRAASTLRQLEISSAQNEQLSSVMTGLYAGYKQNSKSIPGPQAQMKFRDELNQRLDEMEKSGLYSPQQIAPFRRIQSPEGALSVIAGSRAYKDLLSAQKVEDTRTPFQKEAESFYGKDTPAYKKAMADRIKRESAPTASMASHESFEGDNGKLMAALAERGVSLPAGFRSKEQQLGLLNALRKRNEGSTVDQIAEKVKGGQIDLSNEKTWGRVAAGIGGKVAYAENEIKQTIPLVLEASAKLPRGEFIPYNKLVQMGQDKFSNPDLAEFRMYMTSLSNAYDMLAARGGTDMEKRKENRKMFETAQSPQALERVMQAVVKEAQASGRAAQESLRPGKETKPSDGAKPYEDAEKEKRYQEWKKSRG
jgi:hypothetical protein